MLRVGQLEKPRRNSSKSDVLEVKYYPPLIPEGDYEAQCIRSEVYKCFNGQRKAMLWFRIHGGSHDGEELFMACSYPYGSKSISLKINEQWMIAQGRRLRRGEQICLEKFTKRMYFVKVRTTARKFEGGSLKPEFMQYSVVDRILESLTGGFRE